MTSLSLILITDPSANVDPGFNIYLTDVTNNSVNLNLPQITADGMHFLFRNINTGSPTNQTTITPFSGNTVENQPSFTLATGATLHIVAFGLNWYMID